MNHKTISIVHVDDCQHHFVAGSAACFVLLQPVRGEEDTVESRMDDAGRCVALVAYREEMGVTRTALACSCGGLHSLDQAAVTEEVGHVVMERAVVCLVVIAKSRWAEWDRLNIHADYDPSRVHALGIPAQA